LTENGKAGILIAKPVVTALHSSPGGSVAVLTIRGLDEDVKAKLRLEAAKCGCSMEETARRILKRALSAPGAEAGGLGHRLHGYFVDAGEFDLVVPPRSAGRGAPDFSSPES
jgi:antitoxin FitA